MVHNMEGGALEQADVKFDVAFLFGGQIAGRRLRLFMIYAAGNFIECTVDTPYLQIGEHKYGKPILDRAVKYDTDLYDALKIGLISMDSTMRSNLAVGLPIDLAIIRRDALKAELQLPHRAGRALLHRFARALVVGVARGAYGDPAPALRQQRQEITRPIRLQKRTGRKIMAEAQKVATRHGRRHRHRQGRGDRARESRATP